MKGFSNQFRDLPDYILKITQEIWEDRGLASLHHYYAPDIPMRFPSGLARGNQGVIDGTLATLAEFPDRQLLGEDVIWSVDADSGFLSSHRIVTTGTHTGHGAFGAPTGKRFTIRAIADCAAINDQINDEWLVRDVGGIARQLGFDPSDYARLQIAREGGPDKAIRPFHPSHDVQGPYTGRGNDNEWGQRLADILTASWIRILPSSARNTTVPCAPNIGAHKAVGRGSSQRPNGCACARPFPRQRSKSTTKSAATIPAPQTAPPCAGH